MSYSDYFDSGIANFIDSGLNSLDTQRVDFSLIAKWMIKTINIRLKSGSIEYVKTLTGFAQSNMTELEITSPASGTTLTQLQRDEVEIGIKIDAINYNLGIVNLHLDSVDFPNASSSWIIPYTPNLLNNTSIKIRIPAGLCLLYLKNASNKTSNIVYILGGGIPLSVRAIVSWDNPEADIDSCIRINGSSYKDSTVRDVTYCSWGNTGTYGITNPFGGDFGYWDKDAHGDNFGDGHLETFLATTHITGTTHTAGGITAPTGDHNLVVGTYELKCHLWGKNIPASLTDLTVNITASFYVNEVFRFSQQKQVTTALGDKNWNEINNTNGAVFNTLTFSNSDVADLNDPVTPIPSETTITPTLVQFMDVKDALVYEIFLEGIYNTGSGDNNYSVKFGEITIPDRTYPIPKPLTAEKL